MASRLLWASRAASYLRISTFSRAFSNVINSLKYTDSHAWVKVDDTSATIGVTDHAQLPEVGLTVEQGKTFGFVECGTAAIEVYSPVSGEVIEVNTNLNGSPGLVNASPYENGWIIKVKMSDNGELKSLMDSEQYSKFCEEEDATSQNLEYCSESINDSPLLRILGSCEAVHVSEQVLRSI